MNAEKKGSFCSWDHCLRSTKLCIVRQTVAIPLPLVRSSFPVSKFFRVKCRKSGLNLDSSCLCFTAIMNDSVGRDQGINDVLFDLLSSECLPYPIENRNYPQNNPIRSFSFVKTDNNTCKSPFFCLDRRMPAHVQNRFLRRRREYSPDQVWSTKDGKLILDIHSVGANEFPGPEGKIQFDAKRWFAYNVFDRDGRIKVSNQANETDGLYPDAWNPAQKDIMTKGGWSSSSKSTMPISPDRSTCPVAAVAGSNATMRSNRSSFSDSTGWSYFYWFSAVFRVWTKSKSNCKIFGGYLQAAMLKSSCIVLFAHLLKIHPIE